MGGTTSTLKHPTVVRLILVPRQLLVRDILGESTDRKQIGNVLSCCLGKTSQHHGGSSLPKVHAHERAGPSFELKAIGIPQPVGSSGS